MATHKLFSLSIVTASMLAISTPAMADVKTKAVGYEDLDLASAKGQERLKTRVKRAAKQVCSSPRAMTLKERLDQARCENDAMAFAMPKAESTIAMYQETKRLAANETAAVVGN